MKIVDFVRPGALAVRGNAERLLKDVTPQMFARTPVVAGMTITINHPAFVFGHLSLYPAQLAEMTGISSKGMEIPSSYVDLFKMGAPCLDDPSNATYPSMDELTRAFFSGTDALISSLDLISQDALEQPLENPARREKFGTVGSFLTYILLAHPQSHLGQVSGWRRCMGLGPA